MLLCVAYRDWSSALKCSDLIEGQFRISDLSTARDGIKPIRQTKSNRSLNSATGSLSRPQIVELQPAVPAVAQRRAKQLFDRAQRAFVIAFHPIAPSQQSEFPVAASRTAGLQTDPRPLQEAWQSELGKLLQVGNANTMVAIVALIYRCVLPAVLRRALLPVDVRRVALRALHRSGFNLPSSTNSRRRWRFSR